jgi:hypothetical protein
VYQPKFAGFVFYGTSCEPLFVTQANQSNASQWKTSIGANDIATDSWVDGRSNQSQVGAGASYIADPNTSPAFKLCEELTYGGFGDWYLPAVRELQVLQASAVAIGNFLAADYWSSLELGPSDLDSAMQVDFTDGEPANKVKTNSQDVRCVRRN